MADQYQVDSPLDTSQIKVKKPDDDEEQRQRLKDSIAGRTHVTVGPIDLGKTEPYKSPDGNDVTPEINNWIKEAFKAAPIPGIKDTSLGAAASPYVTGVAHTAGLPFTDPAGVAKGLLKTGETIIPSMAQDAAGMWRAIIRGPSDEESQQLNAQYPSRYTGDLPAFLNRSFAQTGKQAGEFAENIPIIGGLLKQREQRYQAALSGVTANPSEGQKLDAATKATEGTVKDFLTRELGHAVTGKNDAGEPMTGEDFGEDAASLAMKVFMLKSGLKAAGAPDLTEVAEGKPTDFTKQTRTAGEILADKMAKGDVDPNAVSMEDTPEGWQKAVNNQLIVKKQPHKQSTDISPMAMEILTGKKTAAQTGVDLTSGTLPIPLDPRGQAGAIDLQPRVANVDKIYSSDVARATETAHILSDNGRIPIEVDQPNAPSVISKGLAAPSMGEWTTKSTEEVAKLNETLPPNQGPPGGESFNDWRDRTIPAFKAIIDEAEANPGSRILGVTHSKNLEMAQAWMDKGSPPPDATGGYSSIQPEDLANQTTSGPASLIRAFKTPEGFNQMGEVQDTSAPGAHFVRHGETAMDAATPGEGTTSSVSDPNRPIDPDARGKAAFDAMPDAVKAQWQMNNMMDVPSMREMHYRMVTDDVLRGALVDQLRDGKTDLNQAVTNVISSREQMIPILQDITNARNASPEDLKLAVANAYRNNATRSGQGLNSLSDVIKNVSDEAFPDTQRGTLAERIKAQDLQRDLGRLKDLIANKNSPIGSTLTMANTYGKIERLRQGQMVDPIRTNLGIAESQLGLAGHDVLDAVMTDTANALRGATNYLVGNKAGPQAPFGNETMSMLLSVAGRFGYDRLLDPLEELNVGGLQPFAGLSVVPRRGQFNRILDAVPRMSGNLQQGLLFDADTSVLGQTLQNLRQANKETPLLSNPSGFAENALTAAQQLTKPAGQNKPFGGPIGPALEAGYNTLTMAVDALNTFNRFQESEFRKLAGEARLRANLNLIPGAPAYGPELEDYLTTPRFDKEGRPIDIDPRIREALIDAEQHALRQTYAYTPNGLMGGALKWLRPITPLGLTFPRSMINNVMWQMHHNPANIADMFDGEFRDAFEGLKDVKTPEASRDASRKLGMALGGLVSMNAAMHIIQGGQLPQRDDPDNKMWRAGPKPWLLWNGDRDEKGQPLYTDMSSYQPLSNALDYAGMLQADLSTSDGIGTFQDTLEHLLNTQISKVPILAADSTVRNLDSKDPEVVQKALYGVLGQYLGSWGSTWKGLKDEAAAANELANKTIPGMIGARQVNPADVAVDKTSQAAEGPWAPVIPESRLKPAVDVFNNKLPATEPHPLLNETKLNPKPMASLEEAMTRAGINPYEITKSYKDPAAQFLVRAATMKIINNPEFKIGDQTMDEFGKKILAMRNPQVAQILIQQVLPIIHKAADGMAQQQDANDNKGYPVHFATEPGSDVKAASYGNPQLEHEMLKRLYDAIKAKEQTPQ